MKNTKQTNILLYPQNLTPPKNYLLDDTQEVKALKANKMLINFVDSCFSIGESQQDKNRRYLKQIKARNTEIIYDAENVYNCEIQKPDNFLEFVFTGLGNEQEHLESYSLKDRKRVIAKVVYIASNYASQIGSSMPICSLQNRPKLNKARSF